MDVLIPTSPSLCSPHIESEEVKESQEFVDDLESEVQNDPDFVESSVSDPHLVNASELNDLAKDMEISQRQSEILASRLKQWNLLEETVNVSCFRNRNRNLQHFFEEKDGLTFCADAKGLIEELGEK